MKDDGLNAELQNAVNLNKRQLVFLCSRAATRIRELKKNLNVEVQRLNEAVNANNLNENF